MKFQINDIVRYIKKPEVKYQVIRTFQGQKGPMVDIKSLDGSTLIISNPEEVLEKVDEQV